MKSRDSGQGSPLTRCWPPLTRCSASGAKSRLLRTLKSFVSIYSHNQVFIRVTMSSPESTAPEEAAGDTQLRCESCDHAPFPSSKALHLHRAQHQLQADVTLPDASSVILTLTLLTVFSSLSLVLVGLVTTESLCVRPNLPTLQQRFCSQSGQSLDCLLFTVFSLPRTCHNRVCLRSAKFANFTVTLLVTVWTVWLFS